MAALHLLSKPGAAASCLAAVAPGDAVLLLGDGVFALTALGDSAAPVGVLREDAASRGVAVPDHVRPMSQADFVDWVVAFDTSVTWR